MNKEPADFKDIALQNEELVITLLRRHGVMSQTQLRKLSGLSMSTSSYIIARLRNKGYILETKGVSTKRGAKPVNLEINSLGCFAIGVELRTDSIYAGLFDFDANIIDEISNPLPDTLPETLASAIKLGVDGLVANNPIVEGKIRGMGVAISGSIRDNSLVVLSSPLGWKNVNFKAILAKVMNIPVMIYSTQVRMLAEIDMESPKKNMIYINIGSGVGGHIILDGHLCNGATGRIGEIGHVIVESDGKKCGCGNTGCLETIISGRAIADKIREDLQNGLCPELISKEQTDDLPENIVAKWGELLIKSDAYSVGLADYVASYLARAVCVMVNICDPEVVTLAGYVSDSCFEYLKSSLTKAFETDVYNNSDRNIVITKATGGSQALITGAAISILR